MFSAQNAAFLNSINTPGAATATFTEASNPLGLSINNAFGRLWPANAPFGLRGIGSSTILDPGGLPLAAAPDPQVGGVFAGDLTPRLPSQAMAGALDAGAVGTAFLGHSPDGSARAVFAVVAADGSIVQEHTGRFWAGVGWAHWSEAAHALAVANHSTRETTSRLFAQMAAGADTIETTWHSRRLYAEDPTAVTLRPITAIRLGGDGNPATPPAPAWTPYIPTQPTPSTCPRTRALTAAPRRPNSPTRWLLPRPSGRCLPA